MKTEEQEGLYRVTVHAIDKAIWGLGIRLSNEEWINFNKIFDSLFSLEVL